VKTSAANGTFDHAPPVVPEGEGVARGLSGARDGLYVQTLEGGVSGLYRLARDGAKLAMRLPFQGTISFVSTDPLADGCWFQLEGWVSPPVICRGAPDGTVTVTDVEPKPAIDVSRYASQEVRVKARDGVMVPLSIVYAKDLKRDGQAPLILVAYGAYGIDLDAGFVARALPWLDLGGVYAVAHVRGGGELGEAWHMAGYKLTKLNTILDFIACGQYLVDHRYTTPTRLAGLGGSAGGITVGGALTRRPELFGVILDVVGMSDTLRFETEPNGPPNVVEFGSTQTEAGFHGLYTMSAYAHVRDGTPYPAVLFSTGANDPRVSPWQMAKMAARVQAATSGGKPALLRIDYDAGHGLGSSTSQRENLIADQWAFALWQMGDAAFQPAAH